MKKNDKGGEGNGSPFAPLLIDTITRKDTINGLGFGPYLYGICLRTA